MALDWYSLTRDCVFYGTVVIVMAVFLADGLIFWYEATILIVGYGVFIIGNSSSFSSLEHSLGILEDFMRLLWGNFQVFISDIL